MGHTWCQWRRLQPWRSRIRVAATKALFWFIGVRGHALHNHPTACTWLQLAGVVRGLRRCFTATTCHPACMCAMMMTMMRSKRTCLLLWRCLDPLITLVTGTVYVIVVAVPSVVSVAAVATTVVAVVVVVVRADSIIWTKVFAN